MLEHADRDDAVVLARSMTVILEQETDASRKTGLGDAPLGDAVLLLREGHAGHVDIGDSREIESEPAPSGADIEHPLARSKPEFRREVAFLVFLGLFQRVVVVGEVGARILPVLVEEEVVKRVRQVVMVGHVAPRPADGVVLLQPAGPAVQPFRQPEDRIFVGVARIDAAIFDEIAEGAFFDGQRAVHIGLADPKPRIGRQLDVQPAIVQPHRAPRPLRSFYPVGASIRVDQRQASGGRHLAQRPVEQHRNGPSRSFACSGGRLAIPERTAKF